MPRPVPFLPALVAVLATTVPGVPAAATGSSAGADDRPPPAARSVAHTPSRAPAASDDPLGVSIEALTPSYVPAKGPIRITGAVTNRSDETWRAVNVHPFVGTDPITSSAALAVETDRSADDYVGDRITRAGNFDNVGDLDPGESAQFSIKLSSSLLGLSEPGVYWFGVHALGETDSIGRDAVADGRARTFVPLVPRTNQVLPTALVLPIRHGIEHTGDGRITDVRRWAGDLDTGGPLRALVDFGASAGSRPLTWLVDPAVPATVQALVAGNPGRSLADTVEEEPGEEVDEDAGSPNPEAEPVPSETATPGPDSEPIPDNAATDPGAAWLNRFREAVTGNQVLALPYGDVDVSAAIERDSQTYLRARRRSGRELEPWGLPTSPAVASPSGYVDPTAIGAIKRRTTTLVTERMFGDDAPGLARVSGRRLVVTSTAAEGGPAPGNRLSAIALRQQILSEAAVRLLSPGNKPLVVVLPQDWAPSSTTGFFQGLDVDWLDLTDLDGLGPRAGGTILPGRLEYPEAQVRRELDAANFASASALVEAGETLQNILLRNDEIAGTVADEALTGLSYASRDRPDAARVDTDRSRHWIARQLGKVRINAPRAVTLSSSRGQFAATVTNDLEHPVTVRVEAVLDAPMRIEGPASIDIAANSRTSVLLDASTSRLGVSNVQLIVTDEDGTPLGSSDELPIRSGQVSQVIWVIMGAGVALLFGAIVVRLVRRVRTSRKAAA